MEGNKSNEEFGNITLRLLDISDVDDFMVWATDEKVTKYCSFDTYKSKQQALDYISNTIVHQSYYRAICLDNRPIGSIGVVLSEDGHKGEVGYLLASAYWGKGIVPRAIEMVVSTIFLEWPQLERVEALVDVENTRSHRVMEKCGFTREGVLRKYIFKKERIWDIVMFSVVSSDKQVQNLRKG